MKYCIKNVQTVNEGKITNSDILINGNRIQKIESNIQDKNAIEINAEGLFALPGIIDDQVHFRQPGFEHKADIFTESRAAAAGGVTTFMEMPNTNPQTLTQQLLQEKYDIAQQNSFVNFSFFMGVSNTNYDEVMRTNKQNVCGLKIFMGSSTGDMLVDDTHILNKIFANAELLIATHCEKEEIIKQNTAIFKEKYGEDIEAKFHPEIRNEAACFESSKLAVDMALKHNTRLHILHISTAKELQLFHNNIPLKEKRITAEACVHHLSFNSDDYAQLGNLIKCNPAIKSENDRSLIFQAVLNDKIDIIATDHAPHTWEEKQNKYWAAPSGLPLVQHSLQMMIEHYQNGKISLEKIVEKMCHAPADCFRIKERGYLREGYFADIVLLDLKTPYTVSKENILYKCAWSPLENKTFSSSINSTFVNGNLIFHKSKIQAESGLGQRLLFERN